MLPESVRVIIARVARRAIRGKRGAGRRPSHLHGRAYLRTRALVIRVRDA